MLTLVACRYLPFVVCGVLKLVEFAALRLWRLGLIIGPFVRNRTSMLSNIEMSAVSDTSKNDLL